MKQYICTGTWRRNNKGDIITEFEYNKMPIEAKRNNYEEYVVKPTFVSSPILSTSSTSSDVNLDLTEISHSRHPWKKHEGNL